MLQKFIHKAHGGWLRVCLPVFLLAVIFLGTLPINSALAKADTVHVLDQPQNMSKYMDSSLDTFMNPGGNAALPPDEDDPDMPYTRPSTNWTPQRESLFSTLPKNGFSPATANIGIEVGEDGVLPLPSSAGVGGLPAGMDSRNIYGIGITIDLTYDVVMGKLSTSEYIGETVIVSMGDYGHGAAVVDDTRFFWTPIWHTADGYAMDLVCGTTISVEVGTDPVKNITPPCLTGGIDILTETVHGTISDTTESRQIIYWPGYFNPELDEQGRLNPGPAEHGDQIYQTVTDPDGSFSFPFAITKDINLGAENLMAVDFRVGDDWIRNYVYPDTPVFMIQQYNIIAGYAEIDQSVTATVYEGAGSSVRWSDTTSAYGPHGFYTFTEVPIEVGDTVEVVLDGVPTLSTTAVALGDFEFDAAADTLTGTAPDGATVRASLWQVESTDLHHYRNFDVAATSGDTFTMDFSTDSFEPIDLRARDDVLVTAEDVNGNQVQILSGPPFVSAYISLDTNLDCVYGRLDGPGLPIVGSLDKGAGEVYTRDTGYFSDVGNSTLFCFTIRDAEDNYVNFDPGDIVTLKDDVTTPSWEGSVDVVDFTWSGDTGGNNINGTTANGDLELTVSQWQGNLYPIRGSDTSQVEVSDGSYSASFGWNGFDVRDGALIDFAHFDPVTGFATETNLWGYQPTLPYFVLNLPYGVSGMAGSPGETVTARLYDGATLLAETSEDKDDDPYQYWLDEFDGHALEVGYRVEVSTSGGWSAEMVIPALSIEGDVDTDILTATGPDGLLLLEVNNNNPDDMQGVSEFVPASTAKWDVSLWGWDLVPSDWVSVTYQALDGNRAYYGKSMHELSEVNLWLDYGARDWMWGMAQPGSHVVAERGSSTLFETDADPGGNWGLEDPLDLYPGDLITLTAGAGEFPVSVEIPDPLTAEADAETDTVWGEIGGWLEEPLEVHGNWEDGYRDLETNASGEYTSDDDPYTDIPKGADGYIRFSNMSNWAWVRYRQYFREPSLLMDVNYAHDWIEGNYAPGYPVVLTVTESDGTTVKGSAEMDTGEIPWWGGGTGFSTSYEDPWIGGQPDIQEGDWVFGEVGFTDKTNAVRIGTITGDVNVEADSVSGTVDAPWLPQDEEVEVWCHPWAEDVEHKGDSVLPNGSDTYTCSWDPATEWDVPPNHDIGVSYYDPGGYDDPDENPVPGSNWVYNAFAGYTDELIMKIHYDHDWIEGYYEPGHDILLVVLDDEGGEKARTTIPTGPIDGWGGQSGFATYLEGVTWDPEHPDIEPGDTVHGEVDDGTEFTADVEIGTITGDPDVDTDSVTGTVSADWLLVPPPEVGEVDVGCHIWEEDGREVYTSVIPDGEDTYTCVFDGDNYYDIATGTNLMVSYIEPDGHQIFGQFYVYSDELIMAIYYDNDMIEGGYEPGHMIHLTVYDGGGTEKAHTTIPTGPIDGWGGQSGFATWLEGTDWDPEHPDIEPGDIVHGEVDDGSEFTADVKVGTITGDVDVGADSVSGTVDAEWLLLPPYSLAEVDVGCHIWENEGREVYTSVIPDGAHTYECVFEGDNTYDIVPGTNLKVSYKEPDGHQVIGDFTIPSPYLLIEKWFIGESPGVGGNAAFIIRYMNQGGLPAEDVTIHDTMVGMTYLRDTSGVTPSVESGDQELTWDLGTVEPMDDWVWFVLFTEVIGAVDDPFINTAEISTSNEFDQGEEWEKISTWEGEIAGNDTHLDVGKSTWTENPAPGEDFVYEINVCNNGSTGSSEVLLTDTLPDNTNFVKWWAGDPGWVEVDQSGHMLEMTHTCISSHSCSSLYVQVTVTGSVGDPLHNHVEIYAENDLEHGDEDIADVYHEIGEPYLDLGIEQGFHGGTLTQGGHYRYGITFRNDGNLAVAGPIEVTATIPDVTSFAGSDSWDAAEGIPDPTIVGNELTWEIGDLVAGAQGTIEVWLDIDPYSEGSPLEHLAEIEVQPGEEYIENNTHLMTEMVYGDGHNLRIFKDGWTEGDIIGYHLYVENVGNESVENIWIFDYYSELLDLNGGVENVHSDYWLEWEVYDDPGDPPGDPSELMVHLEKLEPGEGANINYSMVIADELVAGLLFENNAEIHPTTGDSHPEDNYASWVIGSGPDMYVEKSLDDGAFLPGEEVSFLLSFGNQHHHYAWWWHMNGNAILVDELPDGMSFVSAYLYKCEDTEWCAFDPEISGQTLTWSLYPMGPNDWNHIVLTVQIDSELEESNSLINEVSIASDDPQPDADPFMGNNTSTFDPSVSFDAPVITSADHATFLVGNAGSFTITTTGDPIPDISYTRALPGGLAFEDNGDGTATISGTPEDDSTGTYNLTLSAHNGILPADGQEFTLTIESEGFFIFLPLISH